MAILVAAHPAAAARLRKVLAGHELTFVATVGEAQLALQRGHFPAIVLGVQFDESRMLRLFQHLRSEKHLTTPVVCVIGIKGRLSGAAIDAFNKAARALGAQAVLDLTEFPDDERGNARLRGIIQAAMPASPSASL
jgi:hypothetical protein